MSVIYIEQRIKDLHIVLCLLLSLVILFYVLYAFATFFIFLLLSTEGYKKMIPPQ